MDSAAASGSPASSAASAWSMRRRSSSASLAACATAAAKVRAVSEGAPWPTSISLATSWSALRFRPANK